MEVLSVVVDRGALMSSNTWCMETCNVLCSSRHTMALSIADKLVNSCIACLLGVQPLRLPY